MRACLRDEDTVELYGCWEGSENDDAESRRTINLDDLAADDFYFGEKGHLIVER